MKYLLQIFFFCLVVNIDLYGQDWININPHFDYPDSSLYNYSGFFVNENEGWFKKGYPGNLWHTNDGGKTWEKQINGTYIWLADLNFIDTSHGWVIGYDLSSGNSNFIMITKDGGKNWRKYSAPIFSCITFSDSLNGFAGGDSIYATADGGITWQSQQSDTGITFGIYNIYFIDNKNGWAVGPSGMGTDAGLILNTTDGGKYWKVNKNPSSIFGYRIYFTDSLHGYVVGSDPPVFEGVINITSDGGKSWQIKDLPCTWLNDIVFTDDSTGWAVGDYGFIWRTSDRGLNWTQIESGTNSDLKRIFFFHNGKVGYIFGSNSTLLKYDKTVVDVQNHSPSLPSSFRLYQNYPNPFNPTTRIDYDISQSGPVLLTIYDLLGREVRVLVNEEKKQGNYTVTWDGKNTYGREVSSGVYYYQLRTSFLSQTLKMVLIH
jgi:photosystem II stability/assembly factor-like uncharacterized protein